MLFIYKRIKKDALMVDAENAVKLVTDWFAANPNRRVCHCQLWYGRDVTIRRPCKKHPNSVQELIFGVRDELINTGQVLV